ncbi:hypothetical protein ABZP36_034453 [Zizania latifolia]
MQASSKTQSWSQNKRQTRRPDQERILVGQEPTNPPPLELLRGTGDFPGGYDRGVPRRGIREAGAEGEQRGRRPAVGGKVLGWCGTAAGYKGVDGFGYCSRCLSASASAWRARPRLRSYDLFNYVFKIGNFCTFLHCKSQLSRAFSLSIVNIEEEEEEAEAEKKRIMEVSNLKDLVDEEIAMKTGKVAGIGLAAGTVWGGLVSMLHDGPQVGSNVKYPQLVRTGRVCGNYAASFALLGATYVGIEQTLEKYRMKKDYINGAVAGFAAGATVLGFRVLGLSTSLSPPRGSWVAVRIRHGARPARSNLSLRLRRRRRSAGAIAVRAEVSFVDSDEARRLVAEEGYTVLDIRDRTQHDRAHIKSSTHVALFVENDDGDIGTIVKRTVHNNFAGLFFGLPFTKLNLEFTKTVKEKFSPESKLLVVCQERKGSGWSTAAADALEREGFQNLACITSGLHTLKPGTFESVGKMELENAGKAGLVTVQGKISAVLGTVLISAYLFITLFPDQAEKLFDLAGIKL